MNSDHNLDISYIENYHALSSREISNKVCTSPHQNMIITIRSWFDELRSQSWHLIYWKVSCSYALWSCEISDKVCTSPHQNMIITLRPWFNELRSQSWHLIYWKVSCSYALRSCEISDKVCTNPIKIWLSI